MYQDSRAREIAESIQEAFEAIPRDPILNHHLIHGGLPVVEAKARLGVEMVHAELFWEIREQYWHKQVINSISGIYWYEAEFCGKSILLPQLAEDLVPVAGDKDILVAAKDETIAWLKDASVGFGIWRYAREERDVVECSWQDFLETASHIEWIELWTEDNICEVYSMEANERYDAPSLSLHASLCWGTPGHHSHLDAAPASGSIWFQFTNEPTV